ncbi:MAG: gliding motility-associated C-terminal domain-containing protein [Saprospiraceae bacterium]|nr:gliding motility-associated C-terminal domain-containing protein [Candidatus Opimibacter iunctus]
MRGVDTVTVDNINNNFSVSTIPASNTSCVSPNGAIDLTVTPAGAYTFLWSNGATIEDLSNLSSGSYIVTITDITSCSSIETILITDNLPVVLITPVITSSICGLNNGAIDLSINPPAGNSFLWSNGATVEDLNNLSPGDYIVTVTGTGGCTSVDTFTVPQLGSVITLSGTTTANSNCLAFNGAIDISALPVGAYTYQWSNGMPTQDQVALAPGLFTVTVSDATGCTSSSSFTIVDQAIQPTLQVSVVPATCGNANGQIDITVSPAGSYTFDWSNAAVTEDLLAVSPGMYSVTVTGINGCASDTLVDVMNTGLSFSVSGSTTPHTSCTTWNGAIEITITPGGSYTFLWSDGQSTEDLTAVEPGVYVVTVTDNTGCSTSAQYNVDNNVIPIMVDHLITPVLCGEPNGAIDLTITPASGNTYTWSNGNTTEDLDNIMTGHYEVTITTQNGCNTSAAFDVPGSEGVQITLDASASSSGADLITIAVQLNVSPAAIDSIIWLPENLFNCNTSVCLEQTITRPDTKTEIKVIAIDTNGCLAQDVLLLDALTDPMVYIPNVFSPNGDGINDVFTIYGNKDVDLIVELQIFDRWGNQVFINREFPPNEINFGWDGTFRNKDMNPAVFAYWARVRYKDGTEAPHKGDVTIVR